MRIGCLQFAPQLGDVENNLTRAEAVLSRAASKDVDNLDLLVLPEMAFSGYNFRSLQHVTPHLEHSGAGISSLWARTMALKHNCAVAVGYPEKAGGSRASPEYHNSLILVNGQGQTVGNYRKNFLNDIDEAWALKGEGFHVDEVEGLGQIAMGISMDINPYKFQAPWDAFEFAFHILEVEVNLVIVSMAWPTQEDGSTFSQFRDEPDMEALTYWVQRLEPIIRAESKEEIIVVFCNRCGTEDNVVYSGTSAVLGICDGEVSVYGILGRGSKELLVVDTKLPPFAKLLSQTNTIEVEEPKEVPVVEPEPVPVPVVRSESRSSRPKLAVETGSRVQEVPVPSYAVKQHGLYTPPADAVFDKASSPSSTRQYEVPASTTPLYTPPADSTFGRVSPSCTCRCRTPASTGLYTPEEPVWPYTHGVPSPVSAKSPLSHSSSSFPQSRSRSKAQVAEPQSAKELRQMNRSPFETRSVCGFESAQHSPLEAIPPVAARRASRRPKPIAVDESAEDWYRGESETVDIVVPLIASPSVFQSSFPRSAPIQVEQHYQQLSQMVSMDMAAAAGRVSPPTVRGRSHSLPRSDESAPTFLLPQTTFEGLDKRQPKSSSAAAARESSQERSRRRSSKKSSTSSSSSRSHSVSASQNKNRAPPSPLYMRSPVSV